MKSGLRLELEEVGAGVRLWSQVRNMGLIHENLHNGSLLIELLSGVVVRIKNGLGDLHVQLEHVKFYFLNYNSKLIFPL